MTIPAQRAIRAPIAALVLFETAALLGRSWLQLELAAGGSSERVARDLSYPVVPLILLALAFPVLRAHRGFLVRLFDRRGLTPRALLTGVAIGLLLRAAWWSQLVASVAFGLAGSADADTVPGPLFSFSCPPAATLALYLLVMSLLVPLVEETVNRGFFLHGLLRHGRLAAVAGSSALFAVAHEATSLLVSFAIGATLATTVLRTGTVWMALAAHATFNGVIALDWLCLEGLWNPQRPAPAIGITASGSFAVSATAIFLLLRKAAPAPPAEPAPDPQG